MGHAKSLDHRFDPRVSATDLKLCRWMAVFDGCITLLKEPWAGRAIRTPVKHGIQTLQGTDVVPYLSHPLQVFRRAAEYAPFPTEEAVPDRGRPSLSTADTHGDVDAIFHQIHKSIGKRNLRLDVGKRAHEVKNDGHDS